MTSIKSKGGRPIASDLSVVIPTLGRDCLRDAVAAIANGSMLPAQLVIAYQCPIAQLEPMLREFVALGLNVRSIFSDQTGPGPCRNAGISCVSTALFATTDDDCIAEPRWVEEVHTALSADPRRIVTGRVLASEPGAPSVAASQEPRVFTSVPLNGSHFCGGNFGTTLKIFNDVGAFDESKLVRFCEDPEWAYRALRKGYHIHYLPQIAVTHLHWRDDTNMALVYKNYAFSQGGWFGRRLRRGDLSFLVRLAYELLRGSKRWSLGTLRGDYLRKVNGRAYVVDLLRGVGAGIGGQ